MIEYTGGDFGFEVDWHEVDDHCANAKVFEIVSRDGETNAIAEKEPYLRCYIKWDSCSHFWFGDEDGYLHLCGSSEYKKLVDLMRLLYRRAFELMGREPEDKEHWP